MGVILASTEKQFLLASKFDLEFKIEKISESISSLATEQSELTLASANITDTDSKIYRQLKARAEKLDQLEKQLTLKKDKLQKKLQLIEDLIKSSDQMFANDAKQVAPKWPGGQ